MNIELQILNLRIFSNLAIPIGLKMPMLKLCIVGSKILEVREAHVPQKLGRERRPSKAKILENPTRLNEW